MKSSIKENSKIKKKKLIYIGTVVLSMARMVSAFSPCEFCKFAYAFFNLLSLTKSYAYVQKGDIKMTDKRCTNNAERNLEIVNRKMFGQ